MVDHVGIETRKALAAKFFFDGKMQEFLGYIELGNPKGIELSRAELHELLDVQLDALQRTHYEIRKEAERARRRR
jgi:hypothetical protein